jgi:hypothetical protein
VTKTKTTKQTTKQPAKQPTKQAAKQTNKPATKPTAKVKAKSAGEVEVTVCRRRGPRREADQQVEKPAISTSPRKVETAPETALAPPIERRSKVQRRRQIDPTTCERDYTDDEIEFMHALDAYKRSSGRMFPTCSEILEVVRGLGYIRVGTSGEETAEADGTNARDAELVEAGARQTS